MSMKKKISISLAVVVLSVAIVPSSAMSFEFPRIPPVNNRITTPVSGVILPDISQNIGDYYAFVKKYNEMDAIGYDARLFIGVKLINMECSISDDNCIDLFESDEHGNIGRRVLDYVCYASGSNLLECRIPIFSHGLDLEHLQLQLHVLADHRYFMIFPRVTNNSGRQTPYYHLDLDELVQAGIWLSQEDSSYDAELVNIHRAKYIKMTGKLIVADNFPNDRLDPIIQNIAVYRDDDTRVSGVNCGSNTELRGVFTCYIRQSWLGDDWRNFSLGLGLQNGYLAHILPIKRYYVDLDWMIPSAGDQETQSSDDSIDTSRIPNPTAGIDGNGELAAHFGTVNVSEALGEDGASRLRTFVENSGLNTQSPTLDPPQDAVPLPTVPATTPAADVSIQEPDNGSDVQEEAKQEDDGIFEIPAGFEIVDDNATGENSGCSMVPSTPVNPFIFLLMFATLVPLAYRRIKS